MRMRGRNVTATGGIKALGELDETQQLSNLSGLESQQFVDACCDYRVWT